MDRLNAERSEMDRFEYLKIASYLIPEQQSELWFELRYTSANSSQYDVYMDRYNRRDQELEQAVNPNENDRVNNFYTSFGSVFEKASNIPFTAETGLTYRDIGSLSHPDHPRIRGSVDGYGKDRSGELFILETKTPPKRVPIHAISRRGYLYQVMQNIEILDGDYGLFNDVRLIMCPTKCISHHFLGYDPCTGEEDKCSFGRYQYANLEWQVDDELSTKHLNRPDPKLKLEPVHVICVSLERDFNRYTKSNLESRNVKDIDDSDLLLPRSEGTIQSKLWKKMKEHICPVYKSGVLVKSWIGNLSDTYDKSHPIFSRNDFKDMLISRVFKIRPCGYTRERHQKADEWASATFEKVKKDSKSFGCMFLKVDSQVIQHIPRSTKFWNTYLLPSAEEWLRDMDRRRGVVRFKSKPKSKSKSKFKGDPPIPKGIKHTFEK